MVNRLRLYCILIIAFAGFAACVGFSYCVAVPYTAADALEEAIRGARTPDEVRARIADYFSATAVNRLLLFVMPGLAAAITAALALWELASQRGFAVNSPPAERRDRPASRAP